MAGGILSPIEEAVSEKCILIPFRLICHAAQFFLKSVSSLELRKKLAQGRIGR